MEIYYSKEETRSQGAWDHHVHTAVFKMDNQQGHTVQHMELCSMLCGSLDGRGVQVRMDTCICMAESLCYLPENSYSIVNQLYSNTKLKVKKDTKGKNKGNDQNIKQIVKLKMHFLIPNTFYGQQSFLKNRRKRMKESKVLTTEHQL